MKFATAAAILVGAGLTSVASANKDESYYANGVTNPNVDEKMYWKEGYNILEDLSEFEALYITYHSCAWEPSSSGDENGGGGNEDDTWYLGAYPSWRANAAFSLYGILKGESDDEGCSKSTYINSFHTTEGIESLTNALSAAGLDSLFNYNNGEQQQQDDDGIDDQYLTSTCYQNEQNEGGQDDDSVANGYKYDQNAVSYGLGCSADKSFAIYTFGGAYCDANNILEKEDALEDFNERLDKAKCVPIYKDGDSYNGDDEQGGEDGNSSPLSLLESAKSCQLYDGLGSCPDPYGKLKKYQKQLSQATGAIEYGPWWTPRRVMITAWSMISSGALLALVGFILVIKECCSPSTSDDGPSSKKGRMSRDRSELSEAPSLASRLSRSISESFNGGGGSRRSRSSRSKNSRKSSKSARSRSSKKSSKSQRTNRTERSNRSSRSNRSNLAEKEIRYSNDEFDRSHHSNISDSDHEDEEAAVRAKDRSADNYQEEESVASQSARALNGLVEFVRNRTDEFFNDEGDDESVEMKVPKNSPQASSPQRSVPSEAEVSSVSEKKETKKWRKRRWFRKLLGRK